MSVVSVVSVVSVAFAASCLLVLGCGDKPAAILTDANGVVERQQGHSDWSSAPLATKYFIGDAARTTQSTAELTIGGDAKVAMLEHTVLRFEGTPTSTQISVESGAVDLVGQGSYALGSGSNATTLTGKGTIRISRANGRSLVELSVGNFEMDARGGNIKLEVGKAVDVASDVVVPVDAGVRDAPADAAVADAAEDAGSDASAAIAVKGRRAEIRAPGATAWKPLPAGAGRLAAGASVRLGPDTTAEITSGATTFDLAPRGQLRLGDDLALVLESGSAAAAATAPASIALPGGAVALIGAAGAPAEVKLDGSPRETRVAMQRGGGALTGTGGGELTLNRGESALLTHTGTIRVIEAIPPYFDLRVAVGETLTIHDPRPPAAVQFQFDGKCPDGGIVELDRDRLFRTARVSSGRDFANAMIGPGSIGYRLRCTSNGAEGAAVASGQIALRADDGRRPLPKNQGVNDIDADGRNYRISYQSAIPSVAVHVRNPGTSHRLHLASAGKEQTFDSSTPTVTVPGAQLHEGTYTYWIDRDGTKQDKVSTLTIDFDQTAPQVYIESPTNGQPWNGDIDVRGAVLPGWSAAVDGIPIPLDGQRRFAAKVGAPPGNALAIRLSHPQRGVHYYLRRPK